MTARAWAKQHLPFLRSLERGRRRLTRRVRRSRRAATRALAKGLPQETIERRFRRIYRMNLWRGTDSRSGPGSSLEETAVVRRELPRIVRQLEAQSLLDIPCGDFYWMKEVPLEAVSYIGADLVSRLVEDNNRRYGMDGRMFVRLDVRVDPLPKVDVVLCRDCLDHLSFHDIRSSLGNIARSGAIYLLATTYPDRENSDIRSGDWRPLDLTAAPLGLPQPLELLNEQSRKPGYPDKSLGLWRVSDIAREPG